MSRINPYLTFDNQCREAMTFYHNCFGGELNFLVVKDTPAKGQVPPEMHNSILHSSLRTENFEIMGTDMQPEALREGNDYQLCLICRTEDEAKDFFEKLSKDGTVIQPLHQMFFGIIGVLKDRFGKRWIVECDIPA